MSNMVRKGDFLVFIGGVSGRVLEFFVSTRSFDLDNAYRGLATNRRSVSGLFGFRLENNDYYPIGRSYWVDRKATLEERNTFMQWMKDKGHTFNVNTLELCLNGH